MSASPKFLMFAGPSDQANELTQSLAAPGGQSLRASLRSHRMPELPEVEITARRLGTRALRGAEVESALAPGMVAHEDRRPAARGARGPPDRGRRGAIGKMPVVEFAGDGDPRDARPPDVGRPAPGRSTSGRRFATAASRVLVRLADGRELRLREFGTKQRAWAKLMPAGDVETDEMVATLGPEAWPAPPLEELARRDRPAPPPPPDASRPARDRRHRPVLGGRGPLGGARCRRFARARSSTTRRSSASTTRCTCSATRSTTTRR